MRKIARQSEITPLNTIDEYLWNERLGVTQLPEVSDPQTPQTSSLPPQPSAAPTMDYDSSIAPSDMFGTGVSGAEQAIAPPKAPNTMPASVPARSKAAAVSTLYGDVNPTPTTGEAGNGAQSNRNNSSENLPNGPDSSSPTTPAATAEEGGAGLASDLGEAASLALLASKHFIGSVLDPVDDNVKFAKYHYIRKEGDQYCIWQKGTGKTLSCHDSKEKAEAAFRGMEMSKHSG